MQALAGQKNKEDAEKWNALLLEYKKTKDEALRSELILHYSYIASTVAAQMYGLSSNYAQMEDVVNEGILAVIDCLEKFDPDKGASFKAYAFKRVQGAVIDFVRKQDWFPRRVRVNARNIMEAHDSLCSELMCEPTDQQIAQRLGMTIEEYRKNSYEASNSLVFSFEGILENMASSAERMLLLSDEEASLPEDRLLRQELTQVLAQAIEELSDRERLIISLYYYEHLKLKNIAQVLEVSDQRVSQIHTRAILKIRKKIQKYIRGE